MVNIAIFVVACVVVFGCLMSLGGSPAAGHGGDDHGHGHGGHH